MKIFIRECKSDRKYFDRGWGNGYVLLPEDHIYHGVKYDDIKVHVHGGLTFSELVDDNMIKKWDLDSEDKGKWCVGFDTAHFQDTLELWSEEKVLHETEMLRKQLIEINRIKIRFI